MTAPHSHYFHDVHHLDTVDIYRLLELLSITHPALQHAFKKVAAAGKRGAKDEARDVQEAIDSLVRWQAMRTEDARKGSDALERLTAWAEAMHPGVCYSGDHPVAVARSALGSTRPEHPVGAADSFGPDAAGCCNVTVFQRCKGCPHDAATPQQAIPEGNAA
jgi:hypothetical protein